MAISSTTPRPRPGRTSPPVTIAAPANFHLRTGTPEMRKWKSRTSNYNKVQYAYPTTMNFDAAGKLDLDWYLERTGYIEVATGRARFNY